MDSFDTIDHIAIQVKDINESLEWYKKRFKCREIYSDSTWAFIEFKNTKLALVTKTQHPPHFCILDNKLKFDKDTTEHRDGSISKYIKDYDGNFIEIIKYRK